MNVRAAHLAAWVIALAAIVTGRRRPPPAAKAPDGAADVIGERADGGAAPDGRSDATFDAARDVAEVANPGAGDANAPDAFRDAAGDGGRADVSGEAGSDDAVADAASDTPPADAQDDLAPDVGSGDAPQETASGDAIVDGLDGPADAPSTDGNTSDVRPEDQPCGTLGFPCRPFACDVTRGACKTSCLSDDDCFTGVHCNATNVCGSNEDLTCASNSECVSGHCAQGVCCATACSGPCVSCALAASRGTCTVVPAGAPDPIGTCPTGTVCDERGGCAPPTCSADSDCGSLHFCTDAHCVPCSPTCITDAECAAGAICVDRNFCTYCTIADAGAEQ
jgi:hypothetical protein